MTPEQSWQAANTFDAQALRRARQSAHAHRARGGRDNDLLAERERLIKFWKACAETNSGYLPHNGKWWWVFTWNRCFRRLVLPGARAVLDARDKAKDAAYRAELRAETLRWEAKKAEEAAAKARAKLPQTELFGSASA